MWIGNIFDLNKIFFSTKWGYFENFKGIMIDLKTKKKKKLSIKSNINNKKRKL